MTPWPLSLSQLQQQLQQILVLSLSFCVCKLCTQSWPNFYTLQQSCIGSEIKLFNNAHLDKTFWITSSELFSLLKDNFVKILGRFYSWISWAKFKLTHCSKGIEHPSGKLWEPWSIRSWADIVSWSLYNHLNELMLKLVAGHIV